ncbi:response regulator transcription factor [Streptomyces lavendulae]|uniref:response regulator transcription factor n=1 Tax=Streptomyces lavendulae TaxID=1914 RepID=UPI0036AE2399
MVAGAALAGCGGTAAPVKVPEGWSRTDAADGAVTFTDKLNRIEIVPSAATSAPTPRSVNDSVLPALRGHVPGFAAGTVSTVSRPAGQAVLVTCRGNAPADPVTGTVVRDSVERYVFFRAGHRADLTLSGPVGADDADSLALRGVALRLRRGETVAVLGATRQRYLRPAPGRSRRPVGLPPPHRRRRRRRRERRPVLHPPARRGTARTVTRTPTLLSMPARQDRSPAPVLLVIEDDDTIGRHLEAGLRAQGYATTWCRTGTGGLGAARETTPDVVLLDLGLPDADGIDVARELRSRYPDLLLVIVTARTDEIDVIAGLDAGADDYLVKPFTLSVLLARLRAHLRRLPAAQDDRKATYRIGGLVLDAQARRCTLGGVEVPLRPKEFDLLAVLAQQAGTAVSREDLMARVWDENWFGPTKTLDVTLASLRRRLQAAAREAGPRVEPPSVSTLRGYGYRLETDPV